MLISTSVMGNGVNTLSLYYDDGSIGTLTILAIKKTVMIYKGENPDSVKIGAGHFPFTSVWDGSYIQGQSD